MQGQPWRAACLGLEQAAGTMRMHQRQSGRHGQGGHHRGPHGRPPDDDNAEDLFSNGSKALCPGHHGLRSSSFDGGVLIHLIRRRCCVWMSVLWSSMDNHALSASSSSRSTCRTRLYTLLKHSICQLVAIDIVEALQDGFGFSIGISSVRHHRLCNIMVSVCVYCRRTT